MWIKNPLLNNTGSFLDSPWLLKMYKHVVVDHFKNVEVKITGNTNLFASQGAVQLAC